MTILEGQTLGKYQIVERLGRGGMAEVFKAYQPSLDRYVAIKVLHAHLAADPDFLTRFQREAKAVARLRHPNIIQVYDFDSEGTSYYMVMEYVEGGRSLKDYLQDLRLRSEQIPLTVGLDIAARIADALDYAHGEGMVHRDIKPANILLPDVRKPLLSDFGIARTGLTTQGAMIGTPAYMSPEQGRGEPADERSDIYALGIVLYEMLTAHPPYDADTPYAIILKHINAPLMSPRHELPNLPESVERAVLKSLAKDPLDRYADAGKMRDALKAALREIEDATSPGVATEEIPGRATLVSPVREAAVTVLGAGAAEDEAMTVPLTTSPPAGKRGVPWWGWAAAVGVILVALAVGVLVFPKPVGTQQQAGGAQSAPQAVEISPDVEAKLAGGFEALLRWDPEAAFPIFDALLAETPDLPDSPTGPALASMMMSEIEAADADLARLRELGVSTLRVELAFGLAESWAPDGDAEKALAHFSTVIDSCSADETVCLMALQERANINSWYSDDPGVAMADINRAVEMAPDDLVRAEVLSGRAELRFSTGDAPGAIGDLERSYRLTEGQDWRPWYLETVAFYAVFIGDLDHAQDVYIRLLDRDPQNPSLLAGKGYVAYRMGDTDGAQELADMALEARPDLPQAHYLNGLILLDRGDYPGAIAAFERVMNESDPANYIHPFYRVELGHELHYEMARAYFAAGDLDQALDQVDQSLAIDGWWRGVHIVKANSYEARGDIEHARAELGTAKQIAQERGWGDQAAEIER